jgi:hypothetical protein
MYKEDVITAEECMNYLPLHIWYVVFEYLIKRKGKEKAGLLFS